MLRKPHGTSMLSLIPLKFKLLLIFAAIGTSFASGIWVTKNYYQAKHAKSLEAAIKAADDRHKKDLKLAKSRIKERTIIKYKTRTIVKKVKDAQVKSCPKLPPDYVRLRNEALKH